MQPQTVQMIAIVGVLTTFALAELVRGRFFAREATRQDNRLDIAVSVLFPLISATVLAAAGARCETLMPAQRNALAPWPAWGMLAVLLMADDFTQYRWHRPSHTSVRWPLCAASTATTPSTTR